MVPAGSKAKRLSSINHTTKTIHHHNELFYIFAFPNSNISNINKKFFIAVAQSKQMTYFTIQIHVICFKPIFFWLGLTPCKTKQPLQEKEAQKKLKRTKNLQSIGAC